MFRGFSWKVALFLVVVLALVGSCATGSGSGFAREASKERKAHNSDSGSSDKDKKDDSKSEVQAPPPQLTIHTTPASARVTINGWYSGTGTATLDSRGFGQQATILIEATSYRSKTITVNLWGQTETVEVDLEPILGTLELLGDLGDARILAGGQPVVPGTNRILIGSYAVLARRFGFQDKTVPVVVEEDKTTSITLSLEPAPFSLTAFRTDRPGFNPDSAEIAAKIRVRFRVSAPGHAVLILQDKEGAEWGHWAFTHLTTWDQEVVWNGRREDGAGLPDGTYQVTLTGGSEDGIDTETHQLSVRIDRSLIDKDLASIGPAAGLLWTPSPEVLSPGTAQASFLALAHIEAGLLHAPISASLRVAPAFGWEVFGQTSFRIWSDRSLDSGYVTFSVKRRIPLDTPDFRLAWIAGGTLGSWLTGGLGIPPTDFLTTYPAVRALLPASWAWGKWTILVVPEVDASFWSPSSAYEAAPDSAEGLRLWGYGRLGLAYDAGPYSFALSGAARTRSFDQGTGWLSPAHLGFEGRYPLPGSPLTLTGYLSVSAYSTVDYAWYGGLGVSFLLPSSYTLDLVSQAINSP